jgi:hypothetical protein
MFFIYKIMLLFLAKYVKFYLNIVLSKNFLFHRQNLKLLWNFFIHSKLSIYLAKFIWYCQCVMLFCNFSSYFVKICYRTKKDSPVGYFVTTTLQLYEVYYKKYHEWPKLFIYFPHLYLRLDPDSNPPPPLKKAYPLRCFRDRNFYDSIYIYFGKFSVKYGTLWQNHIGSEYIFQIYVTHL